MNQPVLRSVPPPATIEASWPPFFASSMYDEVLVNERSSITAPMKFRKSATSPILISAISSWSRGFSFAQIPCGT